MTQVGVRDEQRQRTKQRIRWAVLELLESESAATISVPAVARQAGVSLRTVYRYFPTKADLLESASHWHDDRARELTGADPTRASQTGEFLVALWEDFAGNIVGVRAQHNTPAGREFRQIRLIEWRANIGEVLSSRIGHLDEERRADVIDMMIALSSSSMFLELVDRMGHAPDHAAALATELMQALMRQIESTRNAPAEEGPT